MTYVTVSSFLFSERKGSTFDITYSVSLEHMDKTWLASQTKEEEVLGIPVFSFLAECY